MLMFKCNGNAEFSEAILFKTKSEMETYYWPSSHKKKEKKEKKACKMLLTQII